MADDGNPLIIGVFNTEVDETALVRENPDGAGPGDALMVSNAAPGNALNVVSTGEAIALNVSGTQLAVQINATPRPRWKSRSRNNSAWQRRCRPVL